MKLVACLFAGFVLSLSTLISNSEISLNKYSSFALISSAHATGGGPQTTREDAQKKVMNSQQGLEDRHNNASVIIGTGRGTNWDGYGTTEKDIRPQGKKRNADNQDTDLKDGNP